MDRRFGLTLAALLAASACGEGADLMSSPESSMAQPALEMPAPQADLQQLDRKLIRTGEIRLEVDSLEIAISQAHSVALSAGGFIAESAVNEGSAGARSGTVVLRIPASAFDPVETQVRQIGRTLSASSQARDVTREHIDLQTRLDVKSETVERLLALMTRSGTVEDLLAVEREIGRATSELESLKGQMQYMSRQVALSTLRLDLFEPAAAARLGLWAPVSEAISSATRNFAASLGALIFMVASLAPWIVLGLLLYPVFRLLRRRFAVGEHDQPETPDSST